VIDEGGNSPDNASPLLKQEQDVFTMIQHRIAFGIKLIPLVAAERRNPIRILAVDPVRQIDKFRQIVPGLYGPDLHFTSVSPKDYDLFSKKPKRLIRMEQNTQNGGEIINL
jgi:hypothetical protein